MTEITRTIQIQVTLIGDEETIKEVGSKDLANGIREGLIIKMGDADQVLVDVKDFIREGDD